MIVHSSKMENNGESIKCEIQNGDSTKECDFNETSIKSETKQIKAQSDTMKINGVTEDSKPNKCNICSKSFKNEKLIKVHMKRHTLPFKCQFCTLSFSTTGNLKAHIKNQHSNNSELLCDQCNFTTVDKSTLKFHMRMHAAQGPFICQICNKSLPKKGALQKHVKNMHSKDRELMCDQCDFTTVKEYTLKAHKRIHTGETFKCDKCPKEFTTTRNLTQHNLTHTGERKFQCDDCGMAFKREGVLKIHKRKHTGERPYKCDECSETFSLREQFVVHKGKHRGVAEVARQKVAKFSCKECGKVLTTNQILQRHMRTHTGEKPYACRECGKVFSQSYNLRVHSFIHSGKTPFECTECFKVFRMKLPLKKHMLQIHGMEYKDPTPPPSEKTFLKPHEPYPPPSENIFLKPHEPFPPPPEKKFLNPTFPYLTPTRNLYPDQFSLNPSSPENQFLESSYYPSAQPPPTEKPQINTVPPSKNHFQESPVFPSRSTMHLSEDELKGISNLECDFIVPGTTDTTSPCATGTNAPRATGNNALSSTGTIPPCATATIPCAEQSIFSVVDSNSVDKENIKIEPCDLDEDAFLGENIEEVPPEDIGGGDIIKLECTQFGDNDCIKMECDKSEINDIKTELVSSIEKMEPSLETTFKEEIIDKESDELTKHSIEETFEVTKGPKPNQCNVCFKFFESNTNLIIHTRTHTGEKPFSCDKCEYRSNCPSNLRTHKKKHEKPKKEKNPIKKDTYECSECGYKCKQTSTMKKHIMMVHTNERPLKCDQCPKSYKTREDLTYHMEKTHESDTNQYECTDCNKLIRGKISFRFHKRNTCEGMSYVCDQCDYRGKNKRSFKDHIKLNHSGQVFQCQHCPKTYQKLVALNYHIGSAHQTAEDAVTCEHCGKLCPSKLHFWKHKKKCPQLEPDTLNSNVKNKEEKYKAVKCDQCDVTTANNFLMTCHKRIHTGDLFFCDICGKGYTNATNLKHHKTRERKKPGNAHSLENSFIAQEKALVDEKLHTFEGVL